jgi:hypothetical protein
MTPVSDALRGLLSRHGMHDRTVGAGLVVLNKGPALSTMASSGGVAADAREGGQERPPIGRLGGARQPMGMEPGKGRGGHLDNPPKTAVNPGASRSVRGMSLFGCGEASQVCSHAPEGYPSVVTTAPLTDTFRQTSKASWPHVGAVLAVVSRSQIGNPVVGSVPVDVINEQLGETAIDKQPSEPVGRPVFSGKADVDVTLGVDIAGEFARDPLITRVIDPAEFPAFRAVGEILGYVGEKGRDASRVLTHSCTPPVQQGRSVSIKQARRHPFLVVIADNVDVVPTRQGRSSKRLSLMVIEGGKL